MLASTDEVKNYENVYKPLYIHISARRNETHRTPYHQFSSYVSSYFLVINSSYTVLCLLSCSVDIVLAYADFNNKYASFLLVEFSQISSPFMSIIR